MLSYEEAFQATNPDQTDEQRDASARAILAGQAANEAYWNSRTQLEALQARADGHGLIAVGGDSADAPATIVGGGPPSGAGTGSEPKTIDSTVAPEPSAALDAGATPDNNAPAAASPDNPTEAVAKLRAQLEAANITPEA